MNLWEQIEKPSSPGTLKVRRADPDHPHNFFRGRNHRGHYLLQYKGSFILDTALKIPNLAGINISFEQIGDNEAQLTLLLNDSSQSDIFRALCANLMESTIEIPADKDRLVVEVLINRLERWQNLLKQFRERVLTISEQIGLFGEILLLRDKFLTNLKPSDAISSWRGPHDDEQDFLFSDWLVEVKTQMSSSDKKLIISSQDQLDSSSGNIAICHQTLAQSSETDLNSCTLLELVKQVEEVLLASDTYALDLFYSNLIQAKYTERDEYDRVSYVLGDRNFYEAREGFPRIVASDLMEGIGDVRYTIRVDACIEFEVDEVTFDQMIFEINE